jgi:hypothetical protein
MMSLDATRSLWSARIDTRRRRYGLGIYTHVQDRSGLIHDQPIHLGRRQAGAALAGVLRQDNAAVGRLAVDTHALCTAPLTARHSMSRGSRPSASRTSTCAAGSPSMPSPRSRRPTAKRRPPRTVDGA